MATEAPPPRGPPLGLSKLLRKGSDKERQNFNASNSSLASSSDHGLATTGKVPEIVPENTGLRASMESAIDKVKERTRRRPSVDDRDHAMDRRSSGDSRRLSTLVSKTKRKVKNGLKVGDAETERGLSMDSRLGNSEGNRSDSSLALNGSGGSSLLTDDERSDPNQDGDRDRDDGIRPPLIPRQSHQGYLTLSSPEINAHTNPIIPVSEALTSSDAVSVAEVPTRELPHIVEPDNTVNVSSVSLPDRGASPSSKLRGAFTLPRKKSGGETEPTKTLGGGGGGGLGGIFKSSSRRNSVNTQSSGLQDSSPSSLPAKSEINAENRKEVPGTLRRQPVNPTLSVKPQDPQEPPTTLVTPPTPVLDTDTNSTAFAKLSTPPAARSLNSVESIRHRRSQSANLPSKLPSAFNGPLTPTLEETKTPGGSLTSPNLASGFFSSVFSVAQKAGAQFSSNIVPTAKTKTGITAPIETTGQEEVIPGTDSRPGTAPEAGQKKALAVETLGQGSLSLSHLGILEGPDPDTMPSTADMQQHDAQSQNGEGGRKAEEEAAARAVSSAYEQPLHQPPGQATGKAMSLASTDRLASPGDQTPPRTVINGNESVFKRSGSVRSKISGGRRRKHRSSSATQGTSNSIAAALKDSTVGLAQPGVNGLGHRLTGFAVASNKRNKDFHQLFRSVPEDDYLIEDYSAALQRDILLHGRLYVSEGHICFSSNILGWVTNLVISFDEVVSVEKKSTAVIFPNAIVISTLHARNTFASFVARDSTYELLIGIWKISHPNLKSSLNGVQLDEGGTGDRTEVAETELSDTDEATEDEVYDEDEDDDAGSFTDGGMLASTAGSEMGDPTISRKPSASAVIGSSSPPGGISKGLESADAVVTGAAVSSEFPGAPTHEPTQCTEPTEHYDRPLTDTTIPAPLGKVYSMMFGPASGAFMRKWLVEDQKSRELNYVDDKIGLDNEHTTFTFDYIKPLNAPVGPRQTKCITTSTVKAFDLDKAVSIDCSTQTPDVPSGNVFTTKTRYCLMWGPGNSTRMIASCTIEWTGKSWLKGPIEKGANDGQIEYVKSIIVALKAAVTAKPPVKGMPRKGKRKGKKEVFDADEAVAQREAAIAAEQKSPNWGLLEPVRQILDPMFSILGPLITSQVIIVVLGLLLAYSWLSSPRRSAAVGSHGYSAERMAAYDAIWQREESALWDWLDDRVGLGETYVDDRRKALRAKSMGKKLEDEKMSARQMEDAIRTTEERLQALKAAVERKGEKLKKRATS